MERELERVSLLIGEEATTKLQQATVLVVGCGGVGSYAIEALARSGIGHIVIIDKDNIDITNLNRQIMATYETIGKSKVEMMKERISSYSHCKVEVIQTFLDETNIDLVKDKDFVIDAIDTIQSKLDLIEACHKYEIPFVSCLGMGNRLDPSKIKYTKLHQTNYDPLAKSMRYQAKKRGIKYKIPVIFSEEIPMKQNRIVDPDGKTRKDKIPPASMIFVPAAAGLLASSIAIRKIMEEEG